MPRLTPTGRARLLIWAGLAVVIALVALTGPYGGKTAEIENNSLAAALPRGFDSQRVQAELDDYDESERLPVLLVYARDGHPLSEQDLKAIAQDSRDAESLAVDGRVPPPILSQDRSAALVTFVVASQRTDGMELFGDLRSSLGEGLPEGLQAKTAGPYAAVHDMVHAFEGLDKKILLLSAAVVVLVLLLTYRSPVLWILPLLAIMVAALAAETLIYLLATHTSLHVDSLAGGFLPIFVFGVGTDYALLVISRFREELHHQPDRFVAALTAVRKAAPAVFASATTVVAGFSCLLLADLGSSRSLGAVGAIGVGAAALCMLLALPVLLGVAGRWVFWPFVPRPVPSSTPGATAHASRCWRTVADLVSRRRRPIWVGVIVLLGLMSGGLATASIGAAPGEAFRSTPDSVLGQNLLEKHFPAGASAPAMVITSTESLDQTRKAIETTHGVQSVDTLAPSSTGERTLLSVTLQDDPDSKPAAQAVKDLRINLSHVPGADAAVGGPTAEKLDTRDAMIGDLYKVVPAVLLVVAIVLILLLRTITLPILLLGTVLLSYTAAMGLGTLALHAMGFPALDVQHLVLAFVILVALGIDYTIFLMSRIKEESRRHETTEGVRRGLIATGGVITSAGVVLAATFAILASMPTLFMIGIGIIVPIGLLLDTFLVRSLLVPALALEVARTQPPVPDSPGTAT